MSLTTPPSVQKLQTALHDKAKGSPNFRFYALYDKVYREDVMVFAYECCKANRGAAGVDGQTFEDIEEYGLKKWLDELTQELRSRTYRPQPVRRVWIPKPDGKQRPLGVPAIKDRVAQTAAVLVLEPIFEADLQPEQYAYRADRSALDAVEHVHKLLNTGHGQIVDADLSGYFDSIPHADLLIWNDLSSTKNYFLSVSFLLPRRQRKSRSRRLSRRLITLIFAGRNRIIVIRRELPRTKGAGSVRRPTA
jgi:RNA-directed DNA polymerase